MPQKIVVNNEEFFFEPYKEKFLMKRDLNQPQDRVLVYESKIGNFKDLLYRKEVLTARTSEGWFFSKDQGKTWLTANEAERDSKIKLDQRKVYVDLAVNYLSTAIQNYSESNGSITFTTEERIKSNNSKCAELISFDDYRGLNQFFEETLRLNLPKSMGVVLIFPKTKKGIVENSLLDNKSNGKKFVKKRVLKSLNSNFYFVPDFGIENLYLLNYNLIRYKRSFDIKTIVIYDLKQFFTSDQKVDFISSTLNLLCEIADELDIRFIIAYSKRSSFNEKAMNFIANFDHDLLDRFVQLKDKDELTFREAKSF